MPRKKRKGWLPDNVTPYRDRHGKTRYRFRKTGLPTHHFKHEPGTEEFRQELQEALGASPIQRKHAPHSMDDLAHQWLRSPGFTGMADTSQATYRGIVHRYLDTRDRKGRRYGSYSAKQASVAGLERQLGKMAETPAAANNLRKTLKRLFKYAIKLRWRTDNPAAETDGFKTNANGWHTWSDEEIERFRAYYPNGTMARLTLELALNTAARRCNLAALERDHLKNGRWEIAHVKDNDDTSVPISREARAAIDALPAAPMKFYITGAHGGPYTIESLGNRFNKWAREAGCPTNIHGLRKGRSRQLAESGATTSEGRAITGHKSDKTFLHYAAKADRRRLADAVHARANGEPHLANPENI